MLLFWFGFAVKHTKFMLHSFDYCHGISKEHYGLQTLFTQINHQPGQLVSFLSGINNQPPIVNSVMQPFHRCPVFTHTMDWHRAVHFEDDAFLSAVLKNLIKGF